MGECVQERERRKERNRNGERFIATFVDISKVIVLSQNKNVRTRTSRHNSSSSRFHKLDAKSLFGFFSLLFLMLHTIHWLLVLSGLAIPTIG